MTLHQCRLGECFVAGLVPHATTSIATVPLGRKIFIKAGTRTRSLQAEMSVTWDGNHTNTLKNLGTTLAAPFSAIPTFCT